MADVKIETQEDHEQILNLMATKEFNDDIAALLKIRSPIVYLICNEEQRMLSYFERFSAARGYKIYTWDCHMGLLDILTNQKSQSVSSDITDPDNVLDVIIKDAELDKQNAKNLAEKQVNGKVYLLLDFYRYIGDAETERRLKRISQIDSMTTIIITGPSLVTTPGLENLFSVLDFPYPNKNEIRGAIQSICKAVQKSIPTIYDEAKKNEYEIVGSLNGLTLKEAEKAVAKSVVKHRKFNIPTILAEKKMYIRRKGILEFYEQNTHMSDVGGLKRMVRWFERRKLSMESGASDYGLPPIKGALILGIPGTGKSLIAKAVASLYNIPLLRLDFGSLFAAHVGESEEKARNALKIADALEPAILWVDEVEKGISGTASSGSTDGGTTDRVVGTFLTWMQEHKTTVIVLATGNDHEKIPAAFMRAGRFDEIFFVDFPNTTERKQIFEVLVKKYGRNPKNFDISALANKALNYTGAEIEKSITSALFEGYSDNRRDITTDDIMASLSSFQPQYVMRPDYFDDMRVWAKGKGFIEASDPDEGYKDSSRIGIDVG